MCAVRVCLSVGRVRRGVWLGAGRPVVGAGRSVGSLGVRWSRVPVRCVREDLLESAWAGGFRVGPYVRGPCGGLGTGRQVLAVPGPTGVPVGGAGAGSRAAWTLRARTDVRGLMTTSSPAVGCARIPFLPMVCVVPVDSGVCGQGRLSQPQGPASFPLPVPSQSSSSPSVFPLNLLPGVVGGDRAVLLQPRRFRSHGRSPAAEGGASPPTAFSVGTWGGGGGCRLDVWPCWYPSCSRECSWESSRCVCLHP